MSEMKGSGLRAWSIPTMQMKNMKRTDIFTVRLAMKEKTGRFWSSLVER